ncbi:ABC transporter ATP-binding protein [Criblamydia sequanensis]|uniref:ABC-type transporter, ATPase subunit n=1 Tax=Candidatus Criblamydia sequanensis CRIB-18 TaxID=1437425 RepID=A0A090D138_9BACT|nr:ABC transporter ATP-binding protein [Criblamydia sequanensis]CDR33620.1 ABC-type transporter, ATPase subunit [Criblamydia sequanensis CRIB-18]
MSLFEVENLSVEFKKNGFVSFHLEPLSFSLKKGSILGIAGESGSGKSTLAKALLGILPLKTGRILLKGTVYDSSDFKQKRNYQAKVQFVFQDVYSSFNPSLSLKASLLEPLEIHSNLAKKEKLERVLMLVDSVGISKDLIEKTPRELSGGELQRLSIARALTLNPDVIILDEPLSSLDVPLQVEMIEFLRKKVKEEEVSLIMISHDLSVLHFLSDALGLLYHGQFLEYGQTNVIFKTPKHPYTEALIKAIPEPDPEIEKKKQFHFFEEAAFSKKGCPFAAACDRKKDRCLEETPKLERKNENHSVACFY